MEERELHLKDYWRVVRKRRMTVIAVFVVVVVTVAIVTFTATPIYRASCNILIERQTPGGIDALTGSAQVWQAAVEFYPTQYEIIKSGTVARRVIRSLNLVENPLFNPNRAERSLGVADTLKASVSRTTGAGDEAPATQAQEDEVARLADKLLGGLSIQPVKQSQVTQISYEYSNPQLATAVVNEVARAYIDLSMDMKMGATREASVWLAQKIEEQKRKLDLSEQALQAYTRKQDIVSIENRDTITPRKIEEVNTQLVEAETKRREIQVLLTQLQNAAKNTAILETIPVVMNDSIIRSLRSEEIEATKKIEELSKKFGRKHPEMVRALTDLESIQTRKQQEIARVMSSVENDLKFAQAREGTLRKLLEETKGEAMVLSEKSIQYNILKREAISNQQLFDALVKRQNEMSVAKDITVSNITIIEPARTPRVPVKPRKGRNLLLSIIVGLFGAVGIAFLLEYLDNTLKSPEDVEERLGLPFLGLVPLHKTPGRKETGLVDRIATTHPKSTMAEAYRSLRTGLMLSAPTDSGHKVILVTSCVAQEGKTTTAVNIAEVMAQSGKNVLLIDGDMRKPRIHKLYNIRNRIGFSSVLAGLETKVPVQSGKLPNFSVLASGPTPPNPSELLVGSRAKKLFEVLRERYDVIIVDSPPIAMVTDALVLSNIVDTVVLVVRAGRTTYDVATRAVKSLKLAHAHIVGTILNAVDLTKDTYNKYYYYAYQQGYYGEDSKKGEEKKEKA